jgi:hypothetical protein
MCEHLRDSEAMLSIVQSLEIYWDLDEVMEKATTGSSIYSDLDRSIRAAFEKGKLNHMMYMRKWEGIPCCTPLISSTLAAARC